MAEKQKNDSVKKINFPLWEVEEDLVLDSFQTADKPGSHAPLSSEVKATPWSILQTFKPGQNDLLLSALNYGVDSIGLDLDSGQENEFNSLMENVKAEMISLHLSYSSGAALVEGFYALQSFLVKKNIDVHFVKGSLRFSGQQPFDWLAADIDSELPGFAFYYFETPDKVGENAFSDQLVHAFSGLLRTLEKSPLSAEKILQKSVFRIKVGNNFLAEIAKIRTFLRIWDFILDELRISHFLPDLEISVSDRAYGDDIYFNLIRSSSAVLSAVTAGGMRIHLPIQETDQKNAPADPNAFLSRMHANILHLMQHESHLHRVQDPLAGSYLMEELTDKMAELVWKKVREAL